MLFHNKSDLPKNPLVTDNNTHICVFKAELLHVVKLTLINIIVKIDNFRKDLGALFQPKVSVWHRSSKD